MSAFQVHGVSRHAIYESMKRKVEAFESVGGGQYRSLSEEEWIAKVEAAADAAFAIAKPTALSARYDSPRFAEAFVEKAKLDPLVRDLQIKALTPTGERDPETKLPVLKWLPYNPAANLKQVA